MDHAHPALQRYQAELNTLSSEGRFRLCRTVQTVDSAHILIDGQMAVNFSSNDYLGLSQHPRLKQAAIDAIGRDGVGNGASRLISGTSALVASLEATVAAFKQTEAALVFSTGYQANVAIVQALTQAGDWIFADRLNHASLVDGCLLSGARWTRYRHCDLAHLETRLAKAPEQATKWILTDSVFSMDGDFPDLPALLTLAERYNALVMVDEAHATGLYGPMRRSGLCEQMSVSHRVALQMGTFSKALGGMGAYVAGSRLLIDTLINRARGFIYSTAPAPPVLAAAEAAIELVQEDSGYTEQLWHNVAHFETALRANGLGQQSDRFTFPLQSPIVPVLTGSSESAIRLSTHLLAAGYFVQSIRPPTVPANSARLRIALNAIHQPDQLEGLAEALANALLSTGI